MMILRIRYDESAERGSATAASYQGIEGTLPGNLPKKLWNTGDPVADWRTAVRETVEGGIDRISLSSMCDHFVTDCHGIYGWEEEEGFGEVIVRHSPEQALAMAAAFDQEDARLNELAGSEEEGRVFMDEMQAAGDLEDVVHEQLTDEGKEDRALDAFFNNVLRPNYGN